MPQTGSLTVRVFTSQAQLPVSGATVIISSKDENGRHKVYSIQTTDSSGATQPFQLETPDQKRGWGNFNTEAAGIRGEAY